MNVEYDTFGKLYLQLKGGPLGDNLTQLMAKAVMFNFVDRYQKKLKNLALLDSVALLKITATPLHT